jgi:hypothetical protein
MFFKLPGSDKIVDETNDLAAGDARAIGDRGEGDPGEAVCFITGVGDFDQDELMRTFGLAMIENVQ